MPLTLHQSNAKIIESDIADNNLLVVQGVENVILEINGQFFRFPPKEAQLVTSAIDLIASQVEGSAQ